MSEDRIDAEGWLAHTDFLRAIAGRLCAAGDAEDTVQDAMAAALAARTGRVANPRGWLGRVLENAVRERARRAERRRRRELAAARPDSQPSAAEVAGALEMQQRVAEAVRGLPEAYRIAVYLRYYRDLDARAIARDLGVPVETVRTRLKRALAMMRERLDRDGGRTRWVALLAPLARDPRTTFGPLGAGTVIGGLTMASAKWLTGVAALAVLAAGGAWWITRGDAPAPAPASAESPNDPALTASAGGGEVVRTPAEAAGEAPAADGDAPAAAGTADLRGTVVVHDADGTEYRHLSGTFELWSSRGTRAQRAVVRVDGGSFTARVDPDASLRAAEFALGDRRVVELDYGDRFVLPADRTVEVHARFANDVLLHVVDDLTGQELDDVEVRGRSSWRATGDDLVPGDHAFVTTIATAAPSPVLLEEPFVYCIYWVRAPGYAWSRIHVDHRRPGERTVRLAPGGAIEVTLDGPLPDGAFGDDPARQLYVRLYGDGPGEPVVPGTKPPRGRRHLAEVHAEQDGTTRIDDLLPGDYFAAAETGDHETRREIGRARVRIDAGGLARVTVPLAAVDAPPTVPLRGVLVFGDEAVRDADFELWLLREGEGQRMLRIRKDAMEPIEGEARRWRWDAGEGLPGSYQAYFTSLQHRIAFTVTDSGDEVELDLPPLAIANVRAVDATTGAEVVPSKVSWMDGPVAGIDGNMSIDARVDQATGAITIRTVAGTIALSAEHDDYRPATAEVELAPGTNHATIELQPAFGFVLELRSAGALVPVGYAYWHGLRIESPTGRPVTVNSSSRDASHTRYLKAPCELVLHLPELEGYERPDPVRVAVTKGLARVVVDLEAKR